MMIGVETGVGFDPVVEQKETTIAKDLRLNLKRLLQEGALSIEEAHLSLVALAASTEYKVLKEYAVAFLREQGVAEDVIREAAESSAIMAMLNAYYRFRHMLGKEEEYSTAGLRMISLARPAMGKVRFEMLAFAISVLNGCQSCIRSHEDVLRKNEVSADKIHDLARLAAVVKALKTLSTV
jgi:alkyl hydroperoxide reductase subunit D